MAAINSKRFMLALLRSRVGIRNLHANPCMVNPPSPHLHASEYVVPVGVVRHMLFVLTPTSLRLVRKKAQRSRSLSSHWARWTLFFFFASAFFCSLYRSRVRK